MWLTHLYLRNTRPGCWQEPGRMSSFVRHLAGMMAIRWLVHSLERGWRLVELQGPFPAVTVTEPS